MPSGLQSPPGVFRIEVVKGWVSKRPHLLGDPGPPASLLQAGDEQGIEPRQVRDVREGIVELGFAQGSSRPIGEAVRFVQGDAQQLPCQRVVGDLLAKARRHAGDLGVEQRRGNDAQIVEDLHILTSGVEDLLDPLIAEDIEERPKIDLRRQRIDHRLVSHRGGLDQTELRPVGGLTHEFGVNRHEWLAGQALAEGSELGGGGDRRHRLAIGLPNGESARVKGRVAAPEDADALEARAS